MSADEKARAFELVQELAGAQVMARMVNEICDAFTPAQKEQLATAFVEGMKKRMTDADWHATGALDRVIQQMASEEVEKRSGDIRERLASAIDARWEQAVTRRVDAILQAAVAKVSEEFILKARR